MKTITLNGGAYNNLEDFFRDIGTQLHFPDAYLHNLVSLEECLTALAASEPITIHWSDYAHARIVFGVSETGVNYLPAVLNILSETEGVTLLLG